jgi:hypothetical protein
MKEPASLWGGALKGSSGGLKKWMVLEVLEDGVFRDAGQVCWWLEHRFGLKCRMNTLRKFLQRLVQQGLLVRDKRRGVRLSYSYGISMEGRRRLRYYRRQGDVSKRTVSTDRREQESEELASLRAKVECLELERDVAMMFALSLQPANVSSVDPPIPLLSEEFDLYHYRMLLHDRNSKSEAISSLLKEQRGIKMDAFKLLTQNPRPSSLSRAKSEYSWMKLQTAACRGPLFSSTPSRQADEPAAKESAKKELASGAQKTAREISPTLAQPTSRKTNANGQAKSKEQKEDWQNFNYAWHRWLTNQASPPGALRKNSEFATPCSK